MSTPSHPKSVGAHKVSSHLQMRAPRKNRGVVRPFVRCSSTCKHIRACQNVYPVGIIPIDDDDPFNATVRAQNNHMSLAEQDPIGNVNVPTSRKQEVATRASGCDERAKHNSGKFEQIDAYVSPLENCSELMPMDENMHERTDT